MATTLREADFYSIEPEPDPVAPAHARQCEPHGWYRGPICPRCLDDVRERRSLSRFAELKGRLLEQGLAREERRRMGPKRIRKRTGSPHHGDVMRARTHCPRGHEYSEENTYRDRNGYRSCRTCKRYFHGEPRPKAGEGG